MARFCLVCGCAITYLTPAQLEEPQWTVGVWVDRNGRRQSAYMLDDRAGDPAAPEHFHVPA